MMKVAIIHDWLTGMRGGEKCLEVFCELFPEADLYTLLYVPGSVSSDIERMPIKTSFIQKLPFAKKGYRRYLPLFPMAVESFNLKGYELILSCSHCVAKGIIPPPDALHISYVLSPMRYAWDMYPDYFGEKGHWGIRFFMHYLRMWDVSSSKRVDHFLSISRHVKSRIRKFYRRDAEIIHPPVDAGRFRLGDKKGDFFLIVSSVAPYKRVDLAIEVFNRMGYRLKIVGSGSEEKRLKSMATSNVEFLGWQPDETVSKLYSECRALIFPGEEDFGIVPLEAMASGKPVIAYGRGGALETVVPYVMKDNVQEIPPTGLFFDEQQVDSLIHAITQFEKIEAEFDPAAIRAHALQWDREIFKEKMKNRILEKVQTGC
jgi:glycosyltransferase involved in cell wall biosynthesis